MVRAAIVATGRYVPERILDNAYFIAKNPYKVCTGRDATGEPIFAKDKENPLEEKKVFLTEEDILRVTGGIKERRMCAPDEDVLDLIEKAYRTCNYPAEQLRGIIIATISDDIRFPSVASRIQERIGATNARNVVDIGAACSGFTHGLHYANLAITSGEGPYLVVGAETLRRFTDETEVNSDLFGDGCGLAILEPSSTENKGIMTVMLDSSSSGTELIYKDKHRKLRMPSAEFGKGGREVFKRATQGMIKMAHDLVETSSISESDVNLYVPHQANGRIVEHIQGKIDPQNKGRIYRNIEWRGNMSAATVPYALSEAIETRKAKEGDLVVLVDMGAGLVFGGALIRL